MSLADDVRALVADQVKLPSDETAPLELASLELIVLAEELEAEFGFVIAARELVPGNFGSVARIVAFVERRLA